MKTKMDILLLITITVITFTKTHAESCTAKETKSTVGTYVSENYDRRWIPGHIEYPTLYYYILCENVNLETGKQLNVLGMERNAFKYVIFKNSSISVVPVGVLTSFTSVTEAFLNTSKIRTIEPGAFSGMVKLEKLHLEDNNITEVVRGTLNSLSNLKTMDISRNHISKIEDNSLHGLLALDKLNLSYNNLNIVSSLTFSSSSALKLLDLSHNRLHKIEESSFSNTRKLEELFLNNNYLTNIFLVNFQNTSVLRILDVSSNQIKEINLNVLPTSLTKMNFSSNVLSNVKNWQNLQNIETVDFRKNNITEISAIGGGIVYLYLGWNNLEILDSFLFSRSDKLNELDLSHNSIQEIKVDSFKGLSKLQYLYLNYNRIKYLPIGCFKDLSSLKFLYLSYNVLTNLEFGTFAGLSNLNELYLGHNKLIGIHENSFYVLNKLKVLHLNDNAINSIKAFSLLTHLQNLSDVTLNNNNWTCNSLLSIVSTFKNKKVRIHEGTNFNVPNIDGIPCTNEITIKTENASNSIIVTNAETSTISANDFETSNANFLKSFSEEEFRNTSFYKYFAEGFKNSSFYEFFNNSFIDNFGNYLETTFNNSKFFKYFEEGFTNSSFYDFFSNKCSSYLEKDFKNTNFFKYFDQDFFNSSFYKYFNEDFKNSQFFNDRNKDLSKNFNDSNFGYENSKNALKVVELENSNKYFELFADKITIFMSVIVVLLLILITVVIMFYVSYRLSSKYEWSKIVGSRLISEADIELV